MSWPGILQLLEATMGKTIEKNNRVVQPGMLTYWVSQYWTGVFRKEQRKCNVKCIKYAWISSGRFDSAKEHNQRNCGQPNLPNLLMCSHSPGPWVEKLWQWRVTWNKMTRQFCPIMVIATSNNLFTQMMDGNAIQPPHVVYIQTVSINTQLCV